MDNLFVPPQSPLRINLLSVLVIALGACVITGWYLQAPLLIQILPDLVPMQFNTALCMVLSGLCLVLLQNNFPRPALGLAALTLLISALTLLQYLADINIGLDELFMEAYITTKSSNPGRMAPNTALCFLLSAVNLCLLCRPTVQVHLLTLSVLLATIVSSLGIIAFAGYLLGIENTYGWGNLTRMAVHTASGFILIGFAQLLYLWPSLTAYGRRYIHLPAGLATFFISVFAWQAINSESQQQLQQEVSELTQVFQNDLAQNLSQMQNAIDRMAKRAQTPAYLNNQDYFSVDAQSYLNSFSGLDQIGFTDLQLNILGITERTPGMTTPAFPAELQNPGKSQTLPLDDRSQKLIMMYPISAGNAQSGWLFLTLNTTNLFNQYISNTSGELFSIKVQDKGVVVFSFDLPLASASEKFTSIAMLPAPTKNWQVSFIPSEKYFSHNNLNALNLILLAGVLTAILVAFSFWTAQQRTQEKQKVQDLLQQRNKALTEAEFARALFQAIFNGAAEGIITFNEKGLIRDINPQAANLLGYDKGSLIGKPIVNLLTERYLNFIQALTTEHNDIFTNLNNFKRECRLRKKDGSTLFARVSIRETKSPKESFMTCVITDMTQEKAHRHLLRMKNAELQRINSALNNFAYIASHDLQEPLRVVGSFTELLKKHLGPDLDEKSEKYMHFIMDGTNRMQMLIQGLLKYSRLDSSPTDFQYLHLLLPLQLACANLNRLIQENQCTIIFEPEQLPHISGNSILLTQLFQNLIANAIKYRSDLTPEIYISCQSSPRFHTITIKDNGVGIEEKYASRIYELFQRLHNRNHSEGYGLGLAISKKIIEMHGGRIWFESTPGSGTTFFLTFPLILTTNEKPANAPG